MNKNLISFLYLLATNIWNQNEGYYFSTVF